MRLRTEIILGLALLASPARSAPKSEAAPEKASAYGDVYAALEDDVKKYELAASYRFGLSNPYFNTHGLGIGGRYYFGHGHYFVGLENVFYFSSLNSYAEDVRKVLGNQGLDNLLSEPRNHTIASFGIVPLSGLLNFFSKTVVPFDLALHLGLGRFTYKDEAARTTLNFGVDYTTILSKGFGVGLGLGIVEENSSEFGWLFNAEFALRLVGRF